jgi:hypothetical protein
MISPAHVRIGLVHAGHNVETEAAEFSGHYFGIIGRVWQCDCVFIGAIAEYKRNAFRQRR